MHSPAFDCLLTGIRTLLRTYPQFSIRRYPKKCILFATSIHWCGRIFSADGVRYNQRNFDCLLNLEPQATGPNQHQFLHLIQRVKTGIPDFTKLMSPLHEFMERVYETSAKRSKPALATVRLDTLDCCDKKQAAFKIYKSRLANIFTLSHRNETQRLFIFTDASDINWSGDVT